MWQFWHFVIVAIYVVAPVLAGVVDLIDSRKQKRSGPSAGLFMTVAAGILLGSMMTIVYGVAIGGWPSVTQIGLASYFAISLLVILKFIDWLMRSGVERVSLRFKGRGKAVRWPAVFAASMVRVLVLFGIGLPYVMAAVLTYRPKVVAADDPRKQLGFQFEPVSFETSDGIHISAWWISAKQKFVRQVDGDDFGTRTVIVCHGLAASKANQMVMSRAFVPAGYNVLIFDFRAHGESGGQFASFGDLERRDVLAAVKWLRVQRPHQTKKIFGVGASMGAAALIAAAADASPEGQAIDAVAVYGTYDDLAATQRAVALAHFPPPMRQVVDAFALPMASAQVGADLQHFRPADLIGNIWPRPVMIIHGYGDQIIPFERGRALYDAAYMPKEKVWLQKSDHNSIIADERTAQQVREFFDRAEPVPVI